MRQLVPDYVAKGLDMDKRVFKTSIIARLEAYGHTFAKGKHGRSYEIGSGTATPHIVDLQLVDIAQPPESAKRTTESNDDPASKRLKASSIGGDVVAVDVETEEVEVGVGAPATTSSSTERRIGGCVDGLGCS